jgi:hypothetical protein
VLAAPPLITERLLYGFGPVVDCAEIGAAAKLGLGVTCSASSVDVISVSRSAEQVLERQLGLPKARRYSLRREKRDRADELRDYVKARVAAYKYPRRRAHIRPGNRSKERDGFVPDSRPPGALPRRQAVNPESTPSQGSPGSALTTSWLATTITIIPTQYNSVHQPHRTTQNRPGYDQHFNDRRR